MTAAQSGSHWTYPKRVRAVAVHDNIITAAGADIAVHQPALPRPIRGEDLETGVQLCATQTRYSLLGVL
jgi:hypothetical protein